MANPMRVVESCYAHFGMELSADARTAMERFIAGRGSGHQNSKFGKVGTTRDNSAHMAAAA